MITIGICDDDLLEREKLIHFCGQCLTDEYAYAIKAYSSAEEVLENELPDILLLDVELEGMDGICLKERLEEGDRRVRILFVTSHGELALEGYGEGVYGFLTKPLDYGKFHIKMKKILRDLIDVNRYIIAQERPGKSQRILLADVLYVRTTDRYVQFYLSDGRAVFDEKNIKTWREELEDKGFVFPYKGYLVNLLWIKGVEREEILLRNGEKVPMSRRETSSVIKKFTKYMFRNAR